MTTEHQIIFANAISGTKHGEWREMAMLEADAGMASPISLYQWAGLIANGIIARGGFPDPLPTVEFTTSPHFGAASLEVPKEGASYEFIALYSGLVSNLWYVITRILSAPTFMPMVGFPEALDTASFQQGPLPRHDLMNVKPPLQLDRVRLAFGEALFERAIIFVTLHEAFHLFHAHNRLVLGRRRRGQPLTLEELRALEWDADIYAGFNSLWWALTSLNEFEAKTNILLSEYERVKQWWVGTYLAMRLMFHDDWPSRPEEWQPYLFNPRGNDPHPPPPLRASVLMLMPGLGVGGQPLPTSLTDMQMTLALLDAVREVERGLSFVTGNEFAWDWFDRLMADGNLAVRSLQDLALVYASLYPELRELVDPRIRLTAPDPEALQRLAAGRTS